MTESIRLTVGPAAHGGHCVARHDGRVVFVRHALPNEEVTAVITESAPDAAYWRADAIEIHEPSPHRVESAWPEAGPGGVGGGELAHVSLPAQRTWKKAVLAESFERFASVEFTGEVRAAPGDDERGGLGYRTRVHAISNAQKRAAMHIHRSRNTLPLEQMPLAVAKIEVLLLARSYPKGVAISVVAPSSDGEPRTFIDGLPWVQGRPDRRENAPSHVREVVAWDGREYEYRVRGTGFWQVHREAPGVLVGEVMERLGDAPRVLDLYAGSGLFTLPLAAAGRDVLSVEGNEGASRDARRNLHQHPSATVVHDDVRAVLRQGVGEFDAIVLDPPRAGAGRSILEALMATNAATIVYVACDPVALARDTATLRDLGYDLGDVAAYDFFPMTHHMETIATFSRR